MDKKKEAIGLLRQFDALRRAGENLKALGEISPSEELEERLAKTEKTLGIIQRGLAALTPEQRLILSRFYIYREKGNPQRLCEALGVEQSSVYRRKDQALAKFIEAIWGDGFLTSVITGSE